MPTDDLVCFSHLRWNFVWQRPQQLLSRASGEYRVWFVEEPIDGDGPPTLDIESASESLTIVTPRLPPGLDEQGRVDAQRRLIENWWTDRGCVDPVLWYYTPMAVPFTRSLPAGIVVYDCMDELSLFQGAPASLRAFEQELLARADLVFTGGVSLYEAKKHQHPAVHAFPSSVDKVHFGAARNRRLPAPLDQAHLPSPRIGFFGVLDERLDVDLLRGLARLRPDYQFILLGPIVKIDPASLPAAPNLHYLGTKTYAELPAYLAGWDVAMLPFARNEATRFISPTKTPEYLAAGRPVVSTSIADVVQPYGVQGLVRIADEPSAFAQAISAALSGDAERLADVDAFLSTMSWERTWGEMRDLIAAVPRRHPHLSSSTSGAGVSPAIAAAGPAA